MTQRHASIADVVQSVLTSDAGGRLTPQQAGDAVEAALRTVIGLNCLKASTLDIDLGNGHTLHCSLKRAVGPTDI
ncbi:hypothetical protein ACFX58_03605 [Sphingomonas sp. NCPPB 2930]